MQSLVSLTLLFTSLLTLTTSSPTPVPAPAADNSAVSPQYYLRTYVSPTEPHEARFNNLYVRNPTKSETQHGLTREKHSSNHTTPVPVSATPSSLPTDPIPSPASSTARTSSSWFPRETRRTRTRGGCLCLPRCSILVSRRYPPFLAIFPMNHCSDPYHLLLRPIRPGV